MKLDKSALELLRAEQCMTHKELAAKAGVSQATILRGMKQDILPPQVGKIAKALEVKPEDIIIQEVMH